MPVTARGTGSGLSGACIPLDGGVVVSFQRMKAILEVDEETASGSRAAGRAARPARCCARDCWPRVPRLSRRVQRDDRRQHCHERRRHAGREARCHPASRTRVEAGSPPVRSSVRGAASSRRHPATTSPSSSSDRKGRSLSSPKRRSSSSPGPRPPRPSSPPSRRWTRSRHRCPRSSPAVSLRRSSSTSTC